MSWTSNGQDRAAILKSTTAYVQVVGTAPNQVGVLTFTGSIGAPFATDSMQVNLTGPIGDGTIPAGTYACVNGTISMVAMLDGAGGASSNTPGVCSVVLANDVENGAQVSGTFTGSLIGIAGTGGTAPTDQTITNGVFSFTDAP